MKQSTALRVLKSGANTFLTGEAGSGKTHVINMFRDWLYDQGINYAVTASTGIAATHIDGTTIHSWCGMGIKNFMTDNDIEMILNDPKKRYVIDQVLRAKVLIIDEISMIDAQILNNVDKILCAINATTLTGEPFGGIQVVFVGDFYQLPPVVKEGKMVFPFNARSWKEADPVVCYLTEQHRQSEPVFMKILTDMRNGKLTKKQISLLTNNDGKELPKTLLYTHNLDVDRINDMELRKIPGEKRTFKMHMNGIPYLAETLKKNCLSPEILELKVGALVMFTRNNFEVGYVNGTLGTVIECHGSYPLVKLKDGRAISVREAKWSIGDNGQEKASIEQIPLRLAWAITVHKSQGMSLESAVVDLSKAFEYGQGYVAVSRVASLSGLYLSKTLSPKAFKMHPEVVEQDKLFRLSSDKMEEMFKDEE